jgi:hypothetical protein
MEITGKVIQVLPERTGTGKKGAWRRQDFILETKGQYPKKICIALWNDRVGLAKEGQEVTASINIESRVNNETWYTQIHAWRVVSGNLAKQDTIMPDDTGDDLPF